MFKNRFEILSRRKLEKLTRRFEHIEISFEESDKFRESSFERAKENRFSYKQSSNVKDDDSVQSAVGRGGYRGRSRSRGYRGNRHRGGGVPHEQAKEPGDSNPIDSADGVHNPTTSSDLSLA